MQRQLNKEEQEEYNKIRQTQYTPAEQENAALCLKYYLAYRENQNIASDKISLAFKCAYFMAEKSQYSVNLKGEKLRGISFSLNTLLKNHKLDDTMVMLKQMTRKIKDIDDDTSLYLSNIVKEISFLITLHTKFEKTFSQKLELREKMMSEEGNYVKIFTSYAWLLFIIAKNQVLRRSLDLLPNTCMIAHIISFLLVLAWDYLKPEALMRTDKRLNENSSAKDIKRIIKEKVLEIFCIKDVNQYSKIANSFEEHFNQMLEKNMFRMNEERWDFLSPENIHYNYKKLDKYYEVSLASNSEHLDERVFFKERTMNLTPSKFTPFARQGYTNKFQKQTLGNKLGVPVKPTKEQTFNSHRVLNYEAIEKEIQNKNITIHELKLPKNIIQSPSMVKVPLVMATPISTGMQMYNFMNEKRKRIRQIHTQERSIDKNLISIMNKVFDLQRAETERINKESKEEMIISLYKIFSEEYLSANPFEKDTPELMRAFLALSMQLVFFVSNISLTFEKIEEELQVPPFQMWKAFDYFLKSDRSMPNPIKLHFLDLQLNYISFKIWESIDMVRKLSLYATKSPKEIAQSDTIFERLLKRMLLHVSFQISRLAKQLQIDEPIAEGVFEIMKQIILNYPTLIWQRHLDQLVICSIYANCKGIGLYKIMFNDIKAKYVESNSNISNIIEDILMCVHVSDHEPPCDIISFYNKIFLVQPGLKEFIANTRNGTVNGGNKNNKKNTLLMSPMKAIIPKDSFKAKTNIVNNPNAKNRNNNNMTPQTQLLFAYNESPMMKYEVNSFRAPLKSKKVLQYQDQQQKIKNKSIEEDLSPYQTKPTTSDNNINPHINNNYQATNDYIKKYARKPTTPVSQQNTISTSHIQTMQHTHQPTIQQLQIPLQNITKQNMNPPHSSNSHRTLFDDKKETYQTQIDPKYKSKNYPMNNYRRE